MRRPKLIWILALFSVIPLAGCNETQIKMACPALKSYSAAEQKRIAAEFDALPADARAMIGDYGPLRKMCRALQQ